MGSSACLLVMEYIPGRALLSEEEPFQAQHILRTAEDLGRWCFATSKRDECANSSAGLLLPNRSLASQTICPV